MSARLSYCRPDVDNQGGRNAKRHHVRKAVVLRTKIRGGVGEPGNTAIEAIEHHRHKDRDCGLGKAAIEGLNN